MCEVIECMNDDNTLFTTLNFESIFSQCLSELLD